jgi:hypothetical protein
LLTKSKTMPNPKPNIKLLKPFPNFHTKSTESKTWQELKAKPRLRRKTMSLNECPTQESTKSNIIIIIVQTHCNNTKAKK